MIGPNGEDVWESYVENKTPAGWRAFWCYGPDELGHEDPSGRTIKIITVVAIAPNP
jgi:hypothetical protein